MEANALQLPFPYRLRKDLQWLARPSGARPVWIVRDRLSRQFFRFGQEERDLLHWLDGQLSLQAIQEKFRARYPSRDVSPQQLLQLYQPLHARGLLIPTIGSIATAPLGDSRSRDRESVDPQLGRSELERQSVGRAAVWGWWNWLHRFAASMTSCRFSGPNPDKMLSRLAPWTDFLFSKFAVTIWLSLSVVTATLLLTQFNELVRSIPSYREIMSLSRLAELAGLFILTRVLHELGHAIVCKRMGATCPDIGILVMLGVPCLYCDTTDSWQLSNRWSRAAVAAAGIYVELIIATVAGLLWYFTNDGPIHTTALQLMLICSVSTWLFNANPLMKYDGYFLLSDLLDAPNLRDHADRYTRQAIASLAFGANVKSFRPFRHLPIAPLVGFSLASFAYRIVLTTSIAAGVWMMFSGWKLHSAGGFFAVLLLIGSVTTPIQRLGRWTKVGWKHGTISRWRTTVTGALAIACLLLVLFLPMPQRVPVHGNLAPAEFQTVYAESSGRLVGIHDKEAFQVTPGQLIAQMENRTLESSLKLTESNLALAQISLNQALRIGFEETNALSQIPALQSAVASSETQLRLRQNEIEHLAVRSPNSGYFVRVPLPPAEIPSYGDRENLYPTTIDRDGFGRWVPLGTVLGRVIVDPQPIIVVRLNDAESARVKVGDRAGVQLASSNQRVVWGKIVGVQRIDSLESRSLADPWEFSQQALSPRPEAKSNSHSEKNESRFIARIELDQPPSVPCWGENAYVVIRSQSRCLADLLVDWLATTFRRPLV